MMMIQIIWIRCEGVKMYVFKCIGNVFFEENESFLHSWCFFNDTPDV